MRRKGNCMYIAKDALREGIGHTFKRAVSRKHINCAHTTYP